MSFSIQLTPDMAPVEPGATTPISVVVVNRTDEQDRFEMEIEGIDPEWKAVPVPVFAVDPNETHEEKVFFKPRRTSESLAGNYPFVVRVRSLNSGDQRTIQGVLQVKPFNHLTMEISPKKGYISPARKQNIFDVALVNLGNTEHTLHLVGTDPEDSCTYEFEHEQFTVAPGQQRDLELVVTPTSQPFFMGGRLIGFTVTGRSIEAPTIAASAQAQLEQRSLLSPTTLIFGLLLALLFGAWLVMMPKPPTLSVSVNPPSVMRGEPVLISWQSEGANRITIRVDEEVIYEGQDLKGTKELTPDKSGTLTIHAVARKDGNEVESTAKVTVEEPPTVPPPSILRMTADPPRVRLGEAFILRYKFGEAVVRGVLSPTGTELDPAISELEVTPSRAGKLEYTVVAYNKSGQTVRKTLEVTVVDESDARIAVFRAEPMIVQAPDTSTTLNWLVTGAVRVELKVNGQVMTVEPSGPARYDISSKSEFVMTAYDSKGRSVTRKLTVDYKEAAPPPTDPPVNTGSTDGSTTGSTGVSTTTGGNP
ncbi:MAG: hypothetical protein ACAH95_18420 [Fimbriimonas sp.]